MTIELNWMAQEDILDNLGRGTFALIPQAKSI